MNQKELDPIQHSKDFKPPKYKGKELTVSYYCRGGGVIHPNIKTHINCKECFSELDHKIHQARQSIHQMIDNF